jgi:hypothetical protein
MFCLLLVVTVLDMVQNQILDECMLFVQLPAGARFTYHIV